MAKKKREHFAEMHAFDCVVQPTKDVMLTGNFSLRGKWNQQFFQNQNPITLELGCGKGEYTIAMAQKYPQRNFIGVDIKGARLWRGAKTAHEDQMTNVAFLRTKVEFITSFFDPEEVAEIWLTFSDPQRKDKRGTKRLTSPLFLDRYQKILKAKGSVNVKTDSRFLYQRSLEAIAQQGHLIELVTDNLYGDAMKSFSPEYQEILQVKTFYEQKFLAQNMPIHYIRFTLNERAQAYLQEK